MPIWLKQKIEKKGFTHTHTHTGSDNVRFAVQLSFFHPAHLFMVFSQTQNHTGNYHTAHTPMFPFAFLNSFAGRAWHYSQITISNHCFAIFNPILAFVFGTFLCFDVTQRLEWESHWEFILFTHSCIHCPSIHSFKYTRPERGDKNHKMCSILSTQSRAGATVTTNSLHTAANNFLGIHRIVCIIIFFMLCISSSSSLLGSAHRPKRVLSGIFFAFFLNTLLAVY